MALGLRPANERRRYKVMPSLIGWCKPRISPEIDSCPCLLLSCLPPFRWPFWPCWPLTLCLQRWVRMTTMWPVSSWSLWPCLFQNWHATMLATTSLPWKVSSVIWLCGKDTELSILAPTIAYRPTLCNFHSINNCRYVSFGSGNGFVLKVSLNGCGHRLS